MDKHPEAFPEGKINIQKITEPPRMIKLDKGELGHGELLALKNKGALGSSSIVGGDSLVIAPRPQHKIISQTHKTPGTQVVHHNKETGKVSYAKAPDDFHTTH